MIGGNIIGVGYSLDEIISILLKLFFSFIYQAQNKETCIITGVTLLIEIEDFGRKLPITN
jgi:hypothetical protein